jgi:hypothetical protein
MANDVCLTAFGRPVAAEQSCSVLLSPAAALLAVRATVRYELQQRPQDSSHVEQQLYCLKSYIFDRLLLSLFFLLFVILIKIIII